MSSAQMGLLPCQVDEMTPREFAAMAHAYKDKLEYEQEQRRQEIYVSALLMSRFVWTKKVPPYNRVFQMSKPKSMTDEQMLKMAESLNALFGGADKREGGE